MDIRNAKKTLDGRIELEIDHPKFGWIPFTASADDVEELGREIFAEAEKVATDADPLTAQEVDRQAREEKTQADAQAAKSDAKLSRLADMSPAEVRAWVSGNVKNLADAADLLATLAVGVSVLSRKL